MATKDCKELTEVSKDELQYTSLPLLTNSNCGEWTNRKYALTKNMVCAGYLDREDTGKLFGEANILRINT